MKNNKPKAVVLRTAGTNCDAETVYALQLVGADVDLVHVNQLFHQEVKLDDYKILVIPGGFSYGDDVASGKILANELRYKLYEPLKKFVEEGKLVLGICNGFQVLVKCGLLPGYEAFDAEQLTTLTFNDSGKFEDRWVYLKKISSNCVFTKDLPETIYLPVAHGEGKFISKNGEIFARIVRGEQVVFQYVDKNGAVVGYPGNPNGSQNGIAAISNPAGNVMGMMPHPERYVNRLQHPRWTREDLPEEGVGLTIFRSAVKYAKQKL